MTKLDVIPKGLPWVSESESLQRIATARRWNILQGDVPFPVLVLRDRPYRNNLSVLKRMAERHRVELAPHGKTSMCPALFAEQLTHGGCWGISAATVHQAAVMAKHGVQRILLANQVVGRANVAFLADIQLHHPQTTLVSLVDSTDGLDQLVQHSQGRLPPTSRLNVLIELGHANGRTGCRTMLAVERVAEHALALSDKITVAGLSFYEGTIGVKGDANARAEVERFMTFVREGCDFLLPRIAGRTSKAIVSGGGSAYFDIVLNELDAIDRGNVDIVLRGACYFTGDHGYYAKKLGEIKERDAANHVHLGLDADIAPALELICLVQSLNEDETAIMNMGIRDMPFDLGYPKPLRQYRDGRQLRDCTSDWTITGANDQHAYLRYPRGADIAVGDLFSFGISHPCTAFDKWKIFHRVDDDYRVLELHETFF